MSRDLLTDLTAGDATVRTFLPRKLTDASRIQNCSYRKIITYKAPKWNLPIYCQNQPMWNDGLFSGAPLHRCIHVFDGPILKTATIATNGKCFHAMTSHDVCTGTPYIVTAPADVWNHQQAQC